MLTARAISCVMFACMNECTFVWVRVCFWICACLFNFVVPFVPFDTHTYTQHQIIPHLIYICTLLNLITLKIKIFQCVCIYVYVKNHWLNFKINLSGNNLISHHSGAHVTSILPVDDVKATINYLTLSKNADKRKRARERGIQQCVRF